MTQAVERQRAHAATAVTRAFAKHAAINVRQCDQLAELLAEPTRLARRQRREHERIVAVWRAQAQ